ncbi:MAG: apolipoprotein N-acyltransferase [Elusimicrobiales bacterium]|nr:apolipoprotein N-acyltransferase [Elusimicrobiales bacterium]
MREFREKISDQDARQKITFGARLKRFCAGVGNGLFLLLCALATAWLVYESFPRNSRPELAWFALAPFIWGVTRTKGFWSSFFYAWFTALLFHAGIFYWIYYTCLHGGGLSQGLSLAAWLGLSGLLSVQFAVFGGSCYFLKKTGFFFPLLAACGFVALEWVHQTLAFYGLGFPWLMLGYTQWNAPEVLQIVSFTGVYGLSFALAFTGASVGWAFALPGVKRGVGHMCMAALVFLGLFAFGHYRLPSQPLRPGKALLSLHAALMQPNIDQYKKWDETFEAEITDTLEEMGASLTGTDVMLAVWPESAVPGTLLEDRYFNLFKRVAADSGAYQLVGSNVPDGAAQYVGAYLMSPDGETLQSYRKIKLVPFGEYIPLEKWIRGAFPDVEVLGELGAFTPGALGQTPLDLGGVALGRTICYESIFPQLWVTQGRQGAKLFVNITNDAWFFNTAAPYQHLAINAVRAAEMGRPVLRAANTGFSAVIDPFGRVEQKSGLFTRAVLRAEVPLPVGDRVTFYTQWGDWFAWLCAAVYFTLFISVAVFSYE